MQRFKGLEIRWVKDGGGHGWVWVENLICFGLLLKQKSLFKKAYLQGRNSFLREFLRDSSYGFIMDRSTVQTLSKRLIRVSNPSMIHDS
jgi:hypothetical protein